VGTWDRWQSEGGGCAVRSPVSVVAWSSGERKELGGEETGRAESFTVRDAMRTVDPADGDAKE